MKKTLKYLIFVALLVALATLPPAKEPIQAGPDTQITVAVNRELVSFPAQQPHLSR